MCYCTCACYMMCHLLSCNKRNLKFHVIFPLEDRAKCTVKDMHMTHHNYVINVFVNDIYSILTVQVEDLSSFRCERIYSCTSHDRIDHVSSLFSPSVIHENQKH